MNVLYADAIYQKLSKSVLDCRNYWFPNLPRIMRHSVVQHQRFMLHVDVYSSLILTFVLLLNV